MAVKVSVFSPTQNRISIQSEKRNTIRTVDVLPSLGSFGNLDSLSDVAITNPANNQTLVYDSATNVFVNKEIPVIDGGVF